MRRVVQLDVAVDAHVLHLLHVVVPFPVDIAGAGDPARLLVFHSFSISVRRVLTSVCWSDANSARTHYSFTLYRTEYL